jgi:hypothetical protein
MADTAEKARALRLSRLNTMVDTRLEHPAAALEALISELKQGALEPELWERFHAAALRDGVEQDVATAYKGVLARHRLQKLPAAAAGDLLVHAADFFQGVLGDRATAETLLHTVLELVPDHREAFSRLERRFLEPRDNLRLLDLYGLVAATPPKSVDDLAHAVVNALAVLPARSPLPDETCRRLVALVPGGLGVLDALMAHCKKTERAALACELGERTLERLELPKKSVLELRRTLAELYAGEAAMPDGAIGHVETLLEYDATDARARAVANRLLSNRSVGSRAANALQQARRSVRTPGAPEE